MIKSKSFWLPLLFLNTFMIGVYIVGSHYYRYRQNKELINTVKEIRDILNKQPKFDLVDEQSKWVEHCLDLKLTGGQ